MKSSQPTLRVRNLNPNGRRHNIVSHYIWWGSEIHAHKLGDSLTVLTDLPLPLSQSPYVRETGVVVSPPPRPRTMTIQIRVNIKPKRETDRQGNLETVHLSDNSSDEYQSLCKADQTEWNTEIDVDAADISTETPSAWPDTSQASGGLGKSPRPIVYISTTSQSQEVHLIRWTPANHGCMISGRANRQPTFLASTKAYWSPEITHSGTTSSVRSSCPVGEPGIPQLGWPRRATNSRQNTITRAQGSIWEQAMALIVRYTHFDNPQLNPVPLTSHINSVQNVNAAQSILRG